MKKLFVLLFSLGFTVLAWATQVYFEDFSAYTVGSALTANPPNYVTTNSSGTWTVQTAANFGGKAAQNLTTSGWCHAMYNGASYTDTVLTVTGDFSTRWTVFARVTTLGGSSIPTDGYQVLVQNLGSPVIVLYRGGYATELDRYTGAISNQHNFVLKLSIIGTTLNVYLDGSLIIGPITNNTYASGKVGIGTLSDTSAQWGNITVDDGVSSTSTFTATPTYTATRTATPTPTVTPTPSASPCGRRYGDDFGSYPLAMALASTPGYVNVPSSVTTFTVQSGLGNQAAGANTAAGWTEVRYANSFAFNYFDWKVTSKVVGIENLFFDATTFDSTPYPSNGYLLQIPSASWAGGGVPISFYRMPGSRLIGYNATAVPGDYNNFAVRVIDDAGVIDVYLDGVNIIHVVDPFYTSGYIGMGGNSGNSLFTNLDLNDGSCLPTDTSTPTPPPTPTPGLVATTCAAWPVFTMQLTPVLVPVKTYEMDNLQEPNVYKVGNTIHVAYTAGAFSINAVKPSIGDASTTDPLGMTGFVHSNSPIIGNGNGGESGQASRPSYANVAGEHRIYYADSFFNFKYAKSSDGATWSAGNGGAVVIAFNAINRLGAYGIQNVGFALDPNTGNGFALVESTYDTVVVPSVPLFALTRFDSTDGGKTFQYTAGPLSSISTSQVYGGGRPIFRSPTAIGYHVWCHINVPTNIWHLFTPDGYNFTKDASATLTYSTHLFGLNNCNQVADPSMLDLGVQSNLYFDADDNDAPKCYIGLATARGSLSSIERCGAGMPANNASMGLKVKYNKSLNQNQGVPNVR